MKKIITFAVSVSIIALGLVPLTASAENELNSELINNSEVISVNDSSYVNDVIDYNNVIIDDSEIVGATYDMTMTYEPKSSIVQTVTGAALSNDYLTESLTERLNYYLVDGFTNGTIDYDQFNEMVDSGLISETAFFENSVFVGDSLTVGFENYCKSKGSIASDTTYFLARISGSAKACISSNALTKFANIMPIYNGKVQYVEDSISQMPNVEKMFICYGVNDLTGSTPESFIRDYETLINRILEKNPQLSVYVISIPCVAGSANTGYLNNNNIQKANVLIQEMCNENGYGFINLFEHLMDSGNAIKSEYCSDKYVHETNSAYAIWTKVLKDYAFEEITR